MKQIMTCTLLFCFFAAAAQTSEKGNYVPESKIITYNFSANYTMHFISPENIVYADISSAKIMGDQPEKNILRIKAVNATEISITDSFLVTIVTQSFVATYKLKPSNGENAVTVMVQPTDGVMLNNYNNVTKEDFYNIAINAMSKDRNYNTLVSRGFGLKINVNNIYSISDFLILDVSVNNNTDIPYSTDKVRFRIIDKKKTKATVSQDIELSPVYTLYPSEEFTKKMRNIYIFRKFTFPTAKQLNVSITEEQISGRILELNVDYKDVLKADRLQ
jgi:conjugative transposon TraN protein